MNHIDILQKRIDMLEKKIRQCHARLSKIDQEHSAITFRAFLRDNGIQAKDLHLLQYAAEDVDMKQDDRNKVHNLVRPYVDKPVPSRSVAHRINQQVNKIFQQYNKNYNNLLRL